VIADAAANELDEERRAVARAQAGDLRALERVLARHAEPLFAQVVLPRLGNRAVAEELVEETFVTAIEKIGGFAWQGRSIFFWLRQIALHKLIDHHRQRGRAARLVEALEAEAREEPEPGADERLIAEEDRRRALARIDAALARLPERAAQAIRLRLVEERSREACAAELGVAVAHFDVILHRALKSFRDEFGDRDESASEASRLRRARGEEDARGK
jgi:RNA polymerase sigma-70 factor (ECF subfamily)